MWPDVRVGYQWVPRAAHILANEAQRDTVAVKRRLGGLLGAMTQQAAGAGALAPARGHVRKVTHSYWPGLFHSYNVPKLPRTNNDLEQCFGAHRYHERRATERKVASPVLVLSGSVRLVAAAATRLRTFSACQLAPESLSAWKSRHHALATRRQQRTLRCRFRRDPVAYLAQLEVDLLQLILPP